MEAKQLIELCISKLESDIRSLQQVLDTRGHASLHSEAPGSPSVTEALLHRKRSMLSNLLRERRDEEKYEAADH